MTMGMRVAGFGFLCGWGSCLVCGWVRGGGRRGSLYYYYNLAANLSISPLVLNASCGSTPRNRKSCREFI